VLPRLSMTTSVAVSVVVCVLGLLLWLDKALPQAGLTALLLLSMSVGFAHGALDAVLLPQRFHSRVQAALMFVAYLMLVLLLGWVLSMAVGLALWLLLLMSAWHFGEPYGRWDGLPALPGLLTRAVVGGAPVMLPVWLVPDALASILTDVVPAAGMRGWHALAVIWLALVVVWLTVCGLTRRKALRYAWLELLGCVLLYALFSPLMAFAIYFGVYHAPVHVWRVWCVLGEAKTSRVMTMAVLALTMLLTWLLSAALWWALVSGPGAQPDWATALRWLIVAFAALTAPHLVLISLCSKLLAPGR
jgi:beta-carotene 15,15'-dioxygenase